MVHDAQTSERGTTGARCFLLSILLLVSPLVAAAADRPYVIRYNSIHHPVKASGGMVSTQNAVATRVGVEILESGGNAVDAAVAIGFALSVTLPRAGNLGGGGFMLLHTAATQSTTAIEYYGQAPRAVEKIKLLDSASKLDPKKRHSHLGVSVPGTVAGLQHAHTKYGSLAWKKVLEPAIQLAENGITVTDDLAFALKVYRSRLLKNGAAAKSFFKENGTTYEPNDVLIQTDLAWTLKRIAQYGADDFYRGEIAAKITEDMKAHNGALSAQDLESYRVKEQAPLWGQYRGYSIAFMPPPASGVYVQQIMNILENFDIAKMGANSADAIHLMSESMRIADVQRFRYDGGYPQYEVPVRGLASKSHAKKLAAQINLRKVLPKKRVRHGNPFADEKRDTTHFSVIDAQGNTVSNTYTLSSSFGAGVVVEGAGFLLNDHTSNFSLAYGLAGVDQKKTSKAKSLQPGKRVNSTQSPIIVFKDQKPYLATGSPGGSRIISSVVQLLVNVLDHKLNIASATNMPRFHPLRVQGGLELEPGHSLDVFRLLAKKGNVPKYGSTMGSMQSVMWKKGSFYGASDPRRPGALTVGVD